MPQRMTDRGRRSCLSPWTHTSIVQPDPPRKLLCGVEVLRRPVLRRCSRLLRRRGLCLLEKCQLPALRRSWLVRRLLLLLPLPRLFHCRNRPLGR